MTPDLNDFLAEVRQAMKKELAKVEAAEGPATQEVGDNSHLSGTAGVGNADNIQDANDAVDKFVADIASQVVLTTDMDEDEALDFVLDCLEDPEDDRLSPIPDDDADPEELALWLGKAGTFGVAAKILKAAKGE